SESAITASGSRTRQPTQTQQCRRGRILARQPCFPEEQSAAAWTDSSEGLVRGGGLCISRKVDGDQEPIRPVVRKLVTVPFEGFVLALPHAEAVVGLRPPVLQVVHAYFVVVIIAADALERDFAFAVSHLGVDPSGFCVKV